MRLMLATTALLALAGAAGASPTPIALKPPTGYRDFCAGYGKRTGCPSGRAPQRLWRKLALPVVTPGSPCPVSPTRRIPRVAPAVLSAGPALFAAGAYSSSGATTAEMAFPPTAGPAVDTGWGIAKAPLLVRKTFSEPLVIRGRRLDGRAEPLGFSTGTGRPYIALQFSPRSPTIAQGSWKAYGLLMWASAPGCYGLQIDGSTFSRVFVFNVAFLPTA
jgi:hypothetical protein